MKDDFTLFDFLVPVFGIGFLFYKTGWNALTVFITILWMFILINVLLNIDSDVKDKYIYRNLNFYIKKSKSKTNTLYDKSKLRSKR